MVKERIKINISKIMRAYPFFSYLLTYCDIQIGDKVPTMGVNSEGVLFINPGFCKELSDRELCMVLIHEVLHLVYGHIDPRLSKGRNPGLLNVAFDLKVNETIKLMMSEQSKIDFKFPDGALCPDYYDSYRYKGLELKDISKKDSIELYRELYKKIPDDEGNLEGDFDQHMFGDTTPNKNLPAKNDTPRDSQIGDFWRTKVLQAGQHQKMRGIQSGALEGVIESATVSKQDWRQVIQNLIAGNEVTGYSWGKPNKRYLSEDIILPSAIKESVKVRVYIDTSGSVSDDNLKYFLGEINGIFEQFGSVELKMTLFDTQLYPTKEFDSSITKLDIQGRGGTEFKVIFDDDTLDDEDMILIFSDGECPYPDNNDFDGEVIWCITSDGDTSYVEGHNDTILRIEQ